MPSWIHNDKREVMIKPHSSGRPDGYWVDPIGAAYSEWQKASDDDRVRLMLETAIDLAMQGFPLRDVLRAFAQVPQFCKLGGESYPMCRALTQALVGSAWSRTP